MVDCSGKMLLRVYEHLQKTQESYIVCNLCEDTGLIGNFNRVKIALDILIKLGLIRKYKKDKLWYYVACSEYNYGYKPTTIEVEKDVERVIKGENPKCLLSNSSSTSYGDKKMENSEETFVDVNKIPEEEI